MAEIGRDLWISSSPMPLLKQVHLEQVAQDHIQGGFLISPERENPQSLWADWSSAVSP